MRFHVEIVADTNDGDCVTERSLITKDMIDRIKKIAKVIKPSGGSWHTLDQGSPHEDYGDLLSEEDISWFDEFVPKGEYGTHTLDSIKILTIQEEEELL